MKAYELVLSDIGDAFFPDPVEVTEEYPTREDAMKRIREINTTYLKYTYTPILLVHPDGTEEEVYEIG